MTTEGEPLNADEINDMLQTCLTFADPESNQEDPHILYRHYINELVVEEIGNSQCQISKLNQLEKIKLKYTPNAKSDAD